MTDDDEHAALPNEGIDEVVARAILVEPDIAARVEARPVLRLRTLDLLARALSIGAPESWATLVAACADEDRVTDAGATIGAALLLLTAARADPQTGSDLP